MGRSVFFELDLRTRKGRDMRFLPGRQISRLYVKLSAHEHFVILAIVCMRSQSRDVLAVLWFFFTGVRTYLFICRHIKNVVGL